MPSLGLPIYGQKSGSLEERRWKTLEELERAEGVAPGEFPEGAQEPPEGVSRRSFLQVLGASAALAGLEACQPPREKLVPYVRPPDAVTPSVPSAYATAVSDRGYALGLVVTSWEGRPTKIEGNREHPASLGAADAVRQALVLDLYDPRRLSGFKRERRDLSWTAVLAELSALAAAHEKDQGARLRFLVEPTSSPTLADLRRRVLERFPKARFDAWTALGDRDAREGARIAFGRPLEAVLALADADVILSLESDFLAVEGDHLRHAREFAARREPGKLNRLYVAEAGYTVTGGAADHRFRMRSAEVLPFARAVAAELAKLPGLEKLAPLGAGADDERRKLAAAVAKDLARARGRAAVVAGAGQPPALHALAAALNDALGNVGRTVAYREPEVFEPDGAEGGLAALAKEIGAGAVDTLVVTAWNPAYTAPADVPLRTLLSRVKTSIVLAYRDDRTVQAASFRLAKAHVLESWGDLRARDGRATVVQPLIAPLKECATEVDLLAAFVGLGDQGAYRVVRDGWRKRLGFGPPPPPSAGAEATGVGLDVSKPRPADPFERRWEEALSAGLVEESRPPAAAAAADVARVAQALGAAKRPAAGLEVRFVLDYRVQDGRLYENAWLQELPDPVTKLTWENAAMLSPATAKRLGVSPGDVLELARGGRKITAPALVVPGHADESVTLPLGYGQEVHGAVGGGAGFDAYALRTADALAFAGGLEVRRTGEAGKLAVTQGHFTMAGRAIALAVDAKELPTAEVKEKLDAHRGAVPTILPAVDYSQQEYRWGMAIDLSRCIGCGACTLACQAENNIPVVGKEQVLRSREMHWLRVDRYFEGTAEDPKSVTQPLACVHCELAPCEYVCPVNATVHSEEGLNEMVYNRCVGTRYCSNNCPYKVRRFNWFDFNDKLEPTAKMRMNPDVTVRARGVMEKCTYCTQRIERVRIDARSAGRKIGPDEVVPACGQACPAEAIVFGNLADPAAKVSRLHQDGRRYDLLHELGTRPRTAYLVKVRNPNPELA